MSSKVLLRILLLLAVAMLLWAGLAVVNRTSVDSPERLSLPAVPADSADAIAYVSPQDTIRLARTGTGWTVNGHRAAPRVIETFFKSLGDSAARSELVAQSAESHARLGVDSATAKHLTVTGRGKTLLDLWFGNRGPDFEGFYVRQEGDNRVYLLRGTFADLTVQPLEDWRDKQVLALTPDSIARVEVQRGRKSYTLTRDGSAWTLGKGVTADSAKVARWLGTFRELRASSVPSPAQTDSARFAPPERSLKFYGPSGDLLASLALDSIASTFVLRTSEGELYTLDPQMTNLVVPTDSGLRK